MDEEELSDRTPLLIDNDQGTSNSWEILENPYLTVSSLALGGGDCPVGNSRFYFESSSTSNKHDFVQQSIVCVFVAAFDTRKGNVLEWHLPLDCNVEGIEFKAIFSGAHRIQEDFIYFKWDQFYGLACFENMPVGNEAERGARMKAVGVLSVSYSGLHHHKCFLQLQVKHLLKCPNSYKELEEYYHSKKGEIPAIQPESIELSTSSTSHSILFPLRSLNNSMDMKITHPAGSVSQFMNFFGVNIFVIWKHVLLKKRILFFSPPPIGISCYRVFCASCLARHSCLEIGQAICNPLFYINVADMDILSNQNCYIACTTENIFASKAKLYDLYVDNQNLINVVPYNKGLMHPSNADHMRYKQLCKLRLEAVKNLQNGDDLLVDSWFTRYFLILNTNLFGMLLDVSKSPEKLWTDRHMELVGLDPIEDRLFLAELTEVYGFDIICVYENGCCK